MPKKSKNTVSKKKGKSRLKKEAELEAMIEAERKKLEEMQKEQKKSLKNPAKKSGRKKKEGELSDKLRQKKQRPAKEKHHNLQKTIDYHRFLEQQMVKLDYSAMFSYLGNFKQASYDYGGEDEMKKAVYKKEETISWDEIKEFTEDWKMQQIMNSSRAWESSEKRTMYHWWKYLNPGAATIMYELSLT